MPSISSINDGVGDPNCPRCKGIGYLRKDVPVGHPDFGKVFPCECHPARGSHPLQSISRMLPNERALRFSDYVTQGYRGTAEALAACRRFAEKPEHIVTLWGPVGVGKSVLARALCNEMRALNKPAVYMRMSDLLDHVTEGFNQRTGASAIDRLRAISELPILIIDEFDNRRHTDWVQDRVESLVDMRYRLADAHAAGTVFVMNTDPALQSDSIASRQLAGFNCVVHIQGSDARPGLQ